MNILEQNIEKINDVFETFDRMIINGYLLNYFFISYWNLYYYNCQSKKKTQILEVTFRPTKSKHYYFYYNDEEFSFMYLKIQTWFPYNVQI